MMNVIPIPTSTSQTIINLIGKLIHHMNLRTLLCALFMGVTTLLQAQERVCHTMGNLDRLLQEHEQYHDQLEQIEQFTRDFVNTPQLRNAGVVTIPVVVNVVYKTNAQNISDAQIQSQIDVLNDDFRRTNSDADNTWSQAADTEIEFCLASVDPDGNPTNGIRRKSTNKPSWQANDAMKGSQGLTPWDPSSYLNIWVCNLSGGILGYAQFPGGPASTDGVVCDYAYFGTIGTATSPFDLGRTCTHEVGHYLNLRHIWGDGGCSVDDFVGDTPLSDGPNYGCALGHVSCGSVDMVQNYMDYSDDACMNLYTDGQALRMHALFAPGGFRFSLTESGGCGAPADPTCTDGIQNGDETGIDCGGSCAPCAEPTCDDGVQNGDETGVDCGGANCPSCPATCDDGIQNGDETGVDCGGSCAPCPSGSCDVPSGTAAVNIKRKRATLTWSSVASAVSYTVQFRVAGSASWTSEATTSETSITASSLNNNTTYEWRVRSNCNGDASAFSPICSFTAGDANSSSCAGERSALAEIIAYPNPADASVRVEVMLGGDVPVSLVVADAFGRLVIERQVVDGAFVDLDVSALDAGIYLVRATNGLTEEVIRLVVE